MLLFIHITHVKFRKFLTYININFPKWDLIKHIPNKYPQASSCYFYIYENKTCK